MVAELEQVVLDAAIEAVYRNTGIQLKAAPGKKKGGRTIDAEITVEGYRKARFAAEQAAGFAAPAGTHDTIPVTVCPL